MNKIKQNNFKRGESSFTLIYILAGIVGLVVLTYYLMNTKAVPSFGEYMAQNFSNIASSTDTASTTMDVDTSSSMTPSTTIFSNTLNSTSTAVKTLNASSSPAKDLNSRPGKTVISTPKGKIYVDVATTSEDQEKGLGGRLSMPADEGMLFAFKDSATRGFWMQDMNISLDMVWIRRDRTIAGITHVISPDTYPEIFLPPEPVMFVLELNAGAAEKYGMATGTPLTFVL